MYVHRAIYLSTYNVHAHGEIHLSTHTIYIYREILLSIYYMHSTHSIYVYVMIHLSTHKICIYWAIHLNIYILSVVALDEINISGCLHFSMQIIEISCHLECVLYSRHAPATIMIEEDDVDTTCTHQTMTKTSPEFQKDQTKTIGGVVLTKY